MPRERCQQRWQALQRPLLLLLHALFGLMQAVVLPSSSQTSRMPCMLSRRSLSRTSLKLCTAAKEQVKDSEHAFDHIFQAAKRDDLVLAVLEADKAVSAYETGNVSSGDRIDLARALTATIVSCGRLGNATCALNLMSDLRYLNIKPREETYVAVMMACKRAGKWAQVIELYEELRKQQLKPNLITTNIVMGAARECGRWELCLSQLQGLRDRGVAPDAISYSTAISACRRHTRGVQAATLLSQMEAEHLVPKVDDVENALAACAAQATARGRNAAARNEAAQALALGQARWEAERARVDAAPSARMFTAAICLRVASGEWERSAAMLDEMRGAGHEPDTVAYNAVLRGCGRAGEWQAAEAIVERMREAGLQPDSYSFAALGAAYSNAGEWRRAVELLERVEAAGVTPTTHVFGAAMSACAKAGETAEVLRLLGVMRESGAAADLGCYGAAVHACFHAQMWDEVYGLLYDMRRKGITTPESMPPHLKGMWKQAQKQLGLAQPRVIDRAAKKRKWLLLQEELKKKRAAFRKKSRARARKG